MTEATPQDERWLVETYGKTSDELADEAEEGYDVTALVEKIRTAYAEAELALGLFNDATFCTDSIDRKLEAGNGLAVAMRNLLDAYGRPRR